MQVSNELENKISYYYPQIYKFALLKLKSAEQAMDVTQEVFCKYIENQKPFESELHERNWLYRTASNICGSYWRSSWYKRVSLNNEIEIQSVNDGPDKEYMEKEKGQALLKAVLSLPIAYRELIHLFYYENMSIKDIAFITHKNESTIQTQLARGRTKLKKKMEELGYDGF
ncbi:MAG: sigma-70 family RNA polymerase sigma factor [Lachnospiraceae bacterium]|nr:sigma-70 family RNA polymerase sigma factor [Lachnospiraceae bacterium]